MHFNIILNECKLLFQILEDCNLKYMNETRINIAKSYSGRLHDNVLIHWFVLERTVWNISIC